MKAPTEDQLREIVGCGLDDGFVKYVSDICAEHPVDAVCDNAYIMELWEEWLELLE